MASVFSKPTVLPTWGTDPAATVETPPAEKQGLGWQDGELPAAGFMNWLFAVILGWILYLRDFERNAHTWLAAQTFSGGLTSSAFTYSTARVGAVILWAPDFKADAAGGASVTPEAGFASFQVLNNLAAFNPVWFGTPDVSSEGRLFNLAAILRVPAGCTLTSCHVRAGNSDTGNKTIAVVVKHLATDLAGAFTETNLWANGQAVIPAGSGGEWVSAGAPTNSPAVGSDALITVRVVIPATAANKRISFYGLRFAFTQPAVSPSI